MAVITTLKGKCRPHARKHGLHNRSENSKKELKFRSINTNKYFS